MASEAVARPRLSDNLRSALYMVVSMAGFTGNDALIKSVSDELPMFQAIFLRGLLATALVALLAWQQGALSFRMTRRDHRLIGWRIFAEVGSTFCFLTALFHMPIANASAILQSTPLAVTLAAAVFLGEPVGWRRLVAIAIGFLGVMIIVRPGSDGFTVYSLYALATIVFIALRDLVTRSLSPEVSGLAVVTITSAALTLTAGLAAAASDWAPVGFAHVLPLILAALCLLVGYIFGVMTIRTGEIAFVQPFRYSQLIWALLFGILMFGEWPDIWMLVGMGIVVATGLFSFYRERKLIPELE